MSHPAPVPSTTSLRRLEDAARDCQACPLYRDATQTVFGSGPRRAAVMLIGEQPGDMEDREGEPFVGPAGRLLDRALADAGLERSEVYLTNAVKHFKFRRQSGGTRRIHAKPDAAEIAACRPWLAAEVAAVRPRVLVIMGATAARSIVGPSFRVTRHRGDVLRWPDLGTEPALAQADDATGKPWRRPDRATAVVATVHPSSVLRAEDRSGAYADFVADLKVVSRTATAASAA